VTTVKTTAELHAAIEAGADPKTVTIAVAETVDADAIRSAAATEATASERARYAGITALSTPGFDAEIKAALADGSSVEATALTLYTAAKDRGISLSGIQNDATRAAAAAAAAGKGAKTFSAKDIWASRKGAKA
jgi:hypothetical protein